MLAIKKPAQPGQNGRSQVYAFPALKPVAHDARTFQPVVLNSVPPRNPQSVFASMLDNLQKLEDMQRRLHLLLNDLEELDRAQV